jgi:hypothetical protein
LKLVSQHNKGANMPNVAYVRKEVADLKPLYQKIIDALAGEEAIKKAGVKYLPMPNPDDASKENVARYKAYRERAVFYGATQQTHAGFVGQIFARDPVVEVPAALQIIVNDADGSGMTMTQSQKESCGQVLAFNRSGLLVDYPAAPHGGISRKDKDSGKYRATLKTYGPLDIINWDIISVGAKIIASLVVLREKHKYYDDGFEKRFEDQYRELRIVDGVYTVQIWRKDGGATYTVKEAYTPTDASGNTFGEIPFRFIDAGKNDFDPQTPVMGALASVNVAHFRNSADYEELCFIVGQPTVWAAGLTQEWVKDVLKGKLAMGSRGGIPLPVNASAGLLQVQPNTTAFEAMQHKEKLMVALGAKVVEEQSVQRTATEASQDNMAQTSILSSVAKNVAAAYKWALEWCALFEGISPTGIKCELNTDFDIARMKPDERSQLIKEWQGGAITFEEMRSQLRKAGVATLDDNVAKAAIEEEQQAAINLEADRIAATSAADPASNAGAGGQ